MERTASHMAALDSYSRDALDDPLMRLGGSSAASAMLLHACDILSEPVVVVDRDYVVQWRNPRATALMPENRGATCYETYSTETAPCPG